MALTNFIGKKLLKHDVEVAKNYLNEVELNILNRIVTAYLEMAQLQALRRSQIAVQGWTERVSNSLP